MFTNTTTETTYDTDVTGSVEIVTDTPFTWYEVADVGLKFIAALALIVIAARLS